MMNISFTPIQSPGRAGLMDLVAGVLCLDFVNTLDPRVVTTDGTIPRNYLTSYEELVAFAAHAGVLTEVQILRLVQEAYQHPEQAQKVLDQALTLREIFYNIFSAISQHRDIADEALGALTTTYGQAVTHARLMPLNESFTLMWTADELDLWSPLWPIVSSAMDLLRQGERARMKECPSQGEGCGWLFYDTSKNNSRRWCSMRTCGMESKDRRRGKRKRTSTNRKT